jgi:hypothetical protein
MGKLRRSFPKQKGPCIMDWLNLHTSVLDSPECLRCDPVRRATWVWLLRYCIGQENNGIIKGCREWGDATWQQLCRVKLREITLESPLWVWNGNDLCVAYYPTEKQAEVQAKREVGRRGGRPRNDAIRKPSANQMDNHMVSQNVTISQTEGKGKEGKGITPALPADDDLELFEEFWEGYGKKVGRKETLARWKGMTQVQREAATDGVAAYVAASPDPKYRKDPVRYLKGEHWNDAPVAALTNPHPAESAAWWDWFAAHPEAMAK